MINQFLGFSSTRNLLCLVGPKMTECVSISNFLEILCGHDDTCLSGCQGCCSLNTVVSPVSNRPYPWAESSGWNVSAISQEHPKNTQTGREDLIQNVSDWKGWAMQSSEMPNWALGMALRLKQPSTAANSKPPDKRDEFWGNPVLEFLQIPLMLNI